ncbi:MAG: cytochrome c4 [Nitrosomonadales bacterium]|nr:cytochrome c4 [Nitrosomonadales bacterium]
MTPNESISACSLRHRRAVRVIESFLLLMLAISIPLVVPIAARAEGAPNPLCAGCHMEDGNSVTPDFPKIAGLDAAYISKQIMDFKKFKRVSEIMGPMATQISDSEIDALAMYYSKQKRTPGVVTDKNLAEQGQLIYTDGIVNSAVPACSGCHGEKGEGTDKFPRLAGQHTAYLNTQMSNFKNIVRNNDARGVMRAITLRMTDQEMKAASEYIASLKGE